MKTPGLIFFLIISLGINNSSQAHTATFNFDMHTILPALDFYPIIKGELNGRIYVEDALALPSIKVSVAENPSVKIHSFEIVLYNKKTEVKSHKFSGSTAPNIFKQYTYDENDSTQADTYVTHFILKVSIIQNEQVVKLAPRLIYFVNE